MPDQVRRVTHTRITANQGREIEKLKRRPTAGFDPNENPVIIGSGATAGGGSTPDAVSAGAADSVALGKNAVAGGLRSIAIGGSAVGGAAWNDSIVMGTSARVHPSATTGVAAIAIGQQATAGASGQPAAHAVVIGFGANAYAEAVAIGNGAWARTAGAIAIGAGSQAASSSPNGIAIGQNALAADRDLAIALGTACEAHGYGSIAIGNSTYANLTTGDDAIAIGAGAEADGSDAIAIGDIAKARFANSIAIGATVNTSLINQIKIGTTSHKLYLPCLPTSNPGVTGQLWNNGGVVSVA